MPLLKRTSVYLVVRLNENMLARLYYPVRHKKEHRIPQREIVCSPSIRHILIMLLFNFQFMKLGGERVSIL